MTILSMKEMAEKIVSSLEAEYKESIRPRDPLRDAFNTCIKNNIQLPEWVSNGILRIFNNPHLDKLLPTLEKAYQAGNYGALKDAVYWCGKYNAPLPEWATFALFDSLDAMAIGDNATLTKWRTWLKQYKQDMDDYEVYSSVLEAREHGAQWAGNDIYAIAGAIVSNKTEDEGGKKSNTIKKVYQRIGERMEENPLRYFQLKTFQKRNVCHPHRSDLWNWIKKTIKAGKPKGLKNRSL